MSGVVVAINRSLCEAWGLNPAEVFAITITLTPHDLPRATVEMLLNEQVVKHVLNLVPRDDVSE